MIEDSLADLITRLRAEGHLWFEGTQVIGRASDGVEVDLGDLRDRDSLRSYLQAHPGPENW